MSYIDDMLQKLDALSPEDRAKFMSHANESVEGRKFIPHPGPQTDAYFSKADVLLYGGQAGGGKTGLLCGLALEEHTNSLLMRRKFTDLQGGGGLIDELLKLYGSRKGFNGASPPTLRTHDERTITFGGANMPGDEMAFAGRARDFLGIDEATQFTQQQVETLMGWVRTTKKGQRTRTILATNPPLSTVGDWVVAMFAPWLDPSYPNPAEPGELRWFIKDVDGVDVEVDGPEEVMLPGMLKPAKPISRTFIPASTADNPFIGEGYAQTLDNLPPAIRAALRDGDFAAARQDAEWQTIPTEWVRQAFGRWTPQPPPVPMCAMGVDLSGEGPDNNVIASRFDAWYAPLVLFTHKDAPTGSLKAGRVLAARKNGAVVVIDMGGGYGTATFEQLEENGVNCHKFIGSKGTTKQAKITKFEFANVRTAAYWMFREALDPEQEGGAQVALPFDQELLGELTASEYEIRGKKIHLEPKEKVKEKLGRSPDKADAVVMAWWTGPKNFSHGQVWRNAMSQEQGRTKSGPKVVKSRQAARDRYRRKH